MFSQGGDQGFESPMRHQPNRVHGWPLRAALGDQPSDHLWPCGGHPFFETPRGALRSPWLVTPEHEEALFTERVR